jgi:uncharacterized repeat protein (TIGR04076 family)
MSNFKRITLTARQIHNCPLNIVAGERMIFDLPGVAKESDKVCAHVVQSFLPSLMAIAKGNADLSPPMMLTCPSVNKVSWEVSMQEKGDAIAEPKPRKESIVEQDLRRIPFFASLPDYKMAKIIEKLVPYRCGAEQVLARQHEEYKALFLIANGVVDILQRNREGEEVILTKLTRHDYFGEMSLIGREVSSVTIRPSTPVTLIVLSKKSFDAVVREDRALERHFEQYKSENFPGSR